MSDRVEPFSDLGLVAIGRNEGERLRACLASAIGKVASIVYVDSGSTDDSVALAESLGAAVVRLDTNTPFTAARARNEGVARLLSIRRDLAFVQFVDGDCQIIPDWFAIARSALSADEKLAAVCGRRRERNPQASIFNRLIDLEWNTPVGICKSVGGDAMFRIAAFQSAGGFDPTVMAGEEPQLCLRLRHSGWTLRRLDAEMTLHDAAMHRFSQWWRRQVRSGFGALDVYTRFGIEGERLFIKPTQSARLWALVIPFSAFLAFSIATMTSHPWIGAVCGLLIIALIPLQMARMALSALRQGMAPSDAIAHGVLTLVSKFAFLLGQFRYLLDRAAGQRGRLIEYKQPAPLPEVAR